MPDANLLQMTYNKIIQRRTSSMNRLLATPGLKAYAALLVVYVIWGTTLGAIRIGVETIPPALMVCTRFLIAGGLLMGVCLLRGHRLPDRESLKRHCMVGFLLFVMGHAITYWVLQHIATGLNATLGATNPFWMIWFAAVIPPREKIEPLALLGVFIGFVGMLVLLSPQLLHPLEISADFWFSVGATFIMGCFWCLGAIYSRKYPVKDSLYMGLAIQNLFAAAVLVPVVMMTVNLQQVYPSLESILALGYLVLMGTMIAMACYLYTLQHLPVPVVSTIGYVTPVITILFGWLFLQEQMTVPAVIGTVIILAGVMLVQWVIHRDTSLKQPVLEKKPSQV
jgi:drug/metabolite transporter (DMT)-like permease